MVIMINFIIFLSTLWKCKYCHHREWVSICYNFIRDIRGVSIRFINQRKNFKRIIECRLKLFNLELFICHVNQSMS